MPLNGKENKHMMELIINIRKNYKLKLPDAIIAATAIYHKATLITNDKVFYKIDKLKTKNSN